MPLVVIDTRELATEEGRKIKEILRLNKVDIDIQVLDVGDYYIPPGEDTPIGCVIERKTILDLVNAAKTKRLWSQLVKLASLENAQPIIVIEGSLNQIRKFTKWKPRAVAGLIASIMFDFEIPIIQTPGWTWTVEVIHVFVNRIQGEKKPRKIPIRHGKKAETPHDFAKMVLASFPGVNVSRATALLKTFGNLYNAINNVNRWFHVRGIGKKIVESAREVLFADFRREEVE